MIIDKPLIYCHAVFLCHAKTVRWVVPQSTFVVLDLAQLELLLGCCNAGKQVAMRTRL